MNDDYVVGRIGGWVVWHGAQADAVEFAIGEIERLLVLLRARRRLVVRGRGVYSGWGLETALLVRKDE